MIFASNRFRENFASSHRAGVAHQPELHRNFCRFGAIAHPDPNRNANRRVLRRLMAARRL